MNMLIFAKFKIFVPGITSNEIPLLYDKYASVQISGERYGSKFSRMDRFAYIIGKWAAVFNSDVDLESTDERPGVIDCFIKQSITYDGNSYSFCFVYVRWFQRHPNRYHCGKDRATPQIWCSNIYESLGAASFLPVQRISRNFIACFDKVHNENVLFVLAVEKKTFL